MIVASSRVDCRCDWAGYPKCTRQRVEVSILSKRPGTFTPSTHCQFLCSIARLERSLAHRAVLNLGFSCTDRPRLSAGEHPRERRARFPPPPALALRSRGSKFEQGRDSGSFVEVSAYDQPEPERTTWECDTSYPAMRSHSPNH